MLCFITAANVTCCVCFVISSRRRHTRCALVTGVQTCALPIFDDVTMAVHQHFDDPCSAAEIAVDLEGRLGVEHVGIGAFRSQEDAQYVMSAVPLAQPPPEHDAPGRRPAGGAVAPALPRGAGRAAQGYRAGRRDTALGSSRR